MSKYLLKTKLEAVDLYQRGFSTKEIQEKLHITSRRSIDGWINNYQQYGNRGLEKSFSKTRYSGQFKLEVLNWRKEHSASYQITANHFNIKQHSTIANWQRKLNEGGVDALFIKQGRPLMYKKQRSINILLKS